MTSAIGWVAAESVGPWVNVNNSEKQLLELPRQVVRVESDSQQFNIRGANTFTDYNGITVPFVDVEAHTLT